MICKIRCTRRVPELNLWDTAKPFLEQWVADRYSLQTVSRRLQEDAPALLETLPLLPDLISNWLRQPTHPPMDSQRETSWVLPLASAGALAMGVGIGNPQSAGWVLLGSACLLAALFIRKQ